MNFFLHTIAFKNKTALFPTVDGGKRSSSDSSHASGSCTSYTQLDEEKPILLTPDSFTGSSSELLCQSHIPDKKINNNTATVVEKPHNQLISKTDKYQPFVQNLQNNDCISQNVGTTILRRTSEM